MFIKLWRACFSTAPNLLRDAAKYNKGEVGQSHKLKSDQAPENGQFVFDSCKISLLELDAIT